MAELELWEAGGSGSGDDDAVRCPVCRWRRLAAQRGVLLCACGGLRLDLSAEGTGTLGHARERLATAWQSHAAACRAEPAFAQSAGPVGGEHLWLSCASCGELAVVM